MSGYIYCLSNECFKNDILKIGLTKRNPIVRIDELYTTSIPTEFKIELCKKVSDCFKMEKVIHTLLNKYRIDKRREFFNIEIDKVKVIFDLIEGEFMTIDDIKNENDVDEGEDEDFKIQKPRKIYTCEFCNKEFKRELHLFSHLNRKYKCYYDHKY